MTPKSHDSEHLPAAAIADTTILVTPVWNDSARLAHYAPQLAESLAAAKQPIHWVIADDGSDPAERPRLEQLRERQLSTYPHISIYFAPTHEGKGGVVRNAWKQYVDAGWHAFVDADGSISGEDMLGLIRHAWSTDTNVIGVRKQTHTTTIEEHWIRSIRHRIFLLLSKQLMGWDTDDTQCGAKVLRGSDFRRILPLLQEDGFAFDVELLAALQQCGFHWHEIPINWYEKAGSRLRPSDSLKMLVALLRIRRRFQ